jgi:manganese transport protein
MRTLKKLLGFLSLVGPGLFLVGYNIGTGSVTTMAKAGAEFGMSLFWTLLLSCAFTYILMVAYGRVTLVTGRTALNNVRREFKYGKWLALYILTALIMGELLSLMGIMGIVSDLLQEGLRLITNGYVVSKFTITGILVIAMFLLFYHGGYQLFEKIMIVFVIAMGLSFLLVFLLIKPDLYSLFAGLIPKIPNRPGAFSIVAAMAGTTCSAAVFIIRSIVVSEKGWGIGNLRQENKDSFVSATAMLFLSGIIMAVSAGTLHVMNLKLTDTIEMIQLFEPLGGTAAAIILILGITGAGLSTVFPIILIAPWLICDYRGTPRDIRSPLFRILGAAGLLFSFGLLFIEQRPPAMMIFSQAFQACILPAVTLPVLYMINQKPLMKDHSAGPRMNTGLFATLLFSLVTTYFAISEIL